MLLLNSRSAIWAAGSSSILLLALYVMVPAAGLASSFAHDVAAQPWVRPHVGASGATPDESIYYGQWMAYRQFAPVAPQTTINFGTTVAFPQLQYYWAH
jgi:hypothetical protein